MCLWEVLHYDCPEIPYSIYKIINKCERNPCTDPSPGEPGYQPKYHWPSTVNFTIIQHKCIKCAPDHPAFGDNAGLLGPYDYWRDYWIECPDRMWEYVD